jgi:ribosome-dependent ATPase
MKMLTGLLPPTEGTATIFGHSVEAGSMEVRRNLGYMTQAFSLYGELTVRENLVLDARLFHIPPDKATARIDELVERFGLGPHLDLPADSLPFGVKQRLSLAVAVLHDPKLLILDEPTSGVDPVARDGFWEMLVDLSRQQGVTIFVTTHFMNEGMRCDRISLMNAGKVLACDAPQKLIDARRAKNLEEAFIGYMEDAIAHEKTGSTQAKGANGAPAASTAPPAREKAALPLPLRRLLAYTRNEAVQILRDPIRLAFAFLGSALLMIVCGFGITTDVEHIRFAAFDRDQSQDSRTYLEQFRAVSRYFRWEPPIYSDDEALRRLQADEVATVVEIPPNFSRDLRRRDTPDVLAQVDGANPFRGETMSQYVQGVQSTLLKDPGNRLYAGPSRYSATFQDRYMYNPTFESVYSIVPSVPAILLILIPAVLMTVSIVREKELGSIINFYVTPTGRLEYLLGKQLPYIVIGMINFFILVAIALVVFGVPIKGSFLFLTLCTLLYVLVTTGIGMVTSTFTSTQVAAVFVTAILTIQPSIQFSGMLQPVATLEGNARVMGTIWPTTYYMHASLGAYTKGLGLDLMMNDMLYLLACIPVLLLLSTLGLKKQEK